MEVWGGLAGDVSAGGVKRPCSGIPFLLIHELPGCQGISRPHYYEESACNVFAEARLAPTGNTFLFLQIQIPSSPLELVLQLESTSFGNVFYFES